MEGYFNNFNDEEELRARTNDYQHWHDKVVKTLTQFLATHPNVLMHELIFFISEDVVECLKFKGLTGDAPLTSIYGIDVSVVKDKKRYVRVIKKNISN